jgi:hypothetical protein
MRKYRALGDVGLKFIRLEHAVSHTCGPRLDELVDDPFGLSEDLEIGGTVAFGAPGTPRGYFPRGNPS